jgi:hypothetical protein
LKSPPVSQGFRDAVADQHAAHRHIARGHALGEGDQVGPHSDQLSEPNQLPRRPKPADHFVGDQQHIVFVADAADFRPVGGGGMITPPAP